MISEEEIERRLRVREEGHQNLDRNVALICKLRGDPTPELRPFDNYWARKTIVKELEKEGKIRKLELEMGQIGDARIYYVKSRGVVVSYDRELVATWRKEVCGVL